MHSVTFKCSRFRARRTKCLGMTVGLKIQGVLISVWTLWCSCWLCLRLVAFFTTTTCNILSKYHAWKSLFKDFHVWFLLLISFIRNSIKFKVRNFILAQNFRINLCKVIEKSINICYNENTFSNIQKLEILSKEDKMPLDDGWYESTRNCDVAMYILLILVVVVFGGCLFYYN